MKKILGIAASLVLVVIAANAQSDKKEPPPPPPKPKEEVKYKIVKDEKLKNPSPKVVDEKIKVKEPPPPPPKPKEVVKYNPPKIVKYEQLKPPVITVTGKLADEFYQKNPSVSEISRQGNIITVKMKDGTTEKYNMSKKEEDKNFTDKYGKSPIPPPPPPPKVVTKSKG